MANSLSDILARTVAVPSPLGTDCWLWVGAVNEAGYARSKYQGRPVYQLHRLVYQLSRKRVLPFDRGLDHLCRRRHCLNPAHLEPVTQFENTIRGDNFIAAQVRQTHCVRGHPLRGDNLYPDTSRRRCRACRQLQWSELGT